MISKEEIKKWLLDNCIDEYGNLNLSYLDFSDFEGDVKTNGMKVKRNLIQDSQQVGEDLYQYHQQVDKNIYQSHQQAGGNIYQGHQQAGGVLSQLCQKVKENLYQDTQIVGGILLQNYQEVKGDLHQYKQKVGGELLQDEGELSNLEILELLKERLKLTVMGDIVFVPIVKEEIINGEKILIDLGTYKIKEWLKNERN